MFDLMTEQPIPLAEAARLIPPGRSGKRTHLSTLLRWILHGVKAPSGELVKLEAARLGARWVTSREAIQRFSQRLTPQLDSNTPAPRTAGVRRRASEQAAKQLEKIGI